METKELKIIIPENHEIDWQESAKQEKIVFKKKDTKPRSWNAFCEKYPIGNNEYYIHGSDGSIRKSAPGKRDAWADTAVLPSKELAEAFLAMMQLMSLRQAWVGDWESHNPGFLIMLDTKRNIMVSRGFCYGPLTFPTKEMAVDFMNTFKDLLKIAKPLI